MWGGPVTLPEEVFPRDDRVAAGVDVGGNEDVSTWTRCIGRVFGIAAAAAEK